MKNYLAVRGIMDDNVFSDEIREELKRTPARLSMYEVYYIVSSLTKLQGSVLSCVASVTAMLDDQRSQAIDANSEALKKLSLVGGELEVLIDHLNAYREPSDG